MILDDSRYDILLVPVPSGIISMILRQTFGSSVEKVMEFRLRGYFRWKDNARLTISLEDDARQKIGRFCSRADNKLDSKRMEASCQ